MKWLNSGLSRMQVHHGCSVITSLYTYRHFASSEFAVDTTGPKLSHEEDNHKAALRDVIF